MGKFVKLPKAVAGYTHISRPSKFKKFETDLRYSNKDDIKEVVATIEEMIADTFGPKKAAKAKRPYKKDEENGDIIFKTSSNFQPKVYNAKGELIKAARVPTIFGGSTLKAGVALDTYDRDGKYGVTARFKSVQIIKLVSDGGGFEDESGDEDAYTGNGEDGEVEDTKSTSAKSEEADDEDGDDATAF
jgi:hypothetical protein